MDYDADGRMDLLSGSIGGKVHLFRRKPSGAFAAGETLKRRDSSLSLGRDLQVGSGSSACMADWFGTGKLDLIVGTGEGAVFLIRNEGTRKEPRFTKPEPLREGRKPITAENGSAGPFVYDWDKDGLPDLLLGCGSGKVAWYRNVGTKTAPELAAAETLIPACPDDEVKTNSDANPPKRSSHSAKVCPVDWNGDGLTDLVVGDRELIRAGESYRVHGWVWVYLQTPHIVETSSTR